MSKVSALNRLLTFNFACWCKLIEVAFENIN